MHLSGRRNPGFRAQIRRHRPQGGRVRPDRFQSRVWTYAVPACRYRVENLRGAGLSRAGALMTAVLDRITQRIAALEAELARLKIARDVVADMGTEKPPKPAKPQPLFTVVKEAVAPTPGGRT